MSSPIDLNQFLSQALGLNYQVSNIAPPTGEITPQQALLSEFSISNASINLTIKFPNPIGTSNFQVLSIGTYQNGSQGDTPPGVTYTLNLDGTITMNIPITSLDMANGQAVLASSFQSGSLSGLYAQFLINYSDGAGHFSSFILPVQLSGTQATFNVNLLGVTSFQDLMTRIASINSAQFSNVDLTGFNENYDLPLTTSSTANFTLTQSTTAIGNTFKAFMTQFGQYLGFDYSNPSELGALAAFSALIQGGGAIAANNQAFEESLFNKAFSAYLKTDYVKDLVANGSSIPPSGLFEGWTNFLTSFSVISGTTPGTIGGTSFPNVNTYKAIYQAMVPNATDSDFEQALQTFYNDPKGVVQKAGYFLPSQFLDDWIAQVEVDRKSALGLDGLASVTNSNETAILFKVFTLLETMLTALQNVAISQAQKETFYANIQSDYTNLISKIPVYTIANLRATGFTEGDNGLLNNRLQAITNKNQSYTQNLQAFRDLFGDQAKQQQTAIDQSNQEVTQQANLATTILQQMSTIVQSIFSH